MAVLKTVYELASGKPVYEGFGSDPGESASGCGVLEVQLPDFEESRALPVCGVASSWVEDGQRILTRDYPPSPLTLTGLTAFLGTGHVFGDIHAEVTEEDSYTFAQPETEVAIALDLVQDQEGLVQLQPYQWNPQADPAETKGNPPSGVTVVKVDLVRGILPVGAGSLAELVEEG